VQERPGRDSARSRDPARTIAREREFAHPSRPRDDARYRSNAADDIIRYIKTLLTRPGVSCELHRACESESLRATLFAHGLRNVVATVCTRVRSHSLSLSLSLSVFSVVFDSEYVRKRHSNLKGGALASPLRIKQRSSGCDEEGSPRVKSSERNITFYRVYSLSLSLSFSLCGSPGV